ncbi:glycosyltransferase [Micromonospora sp. KC606]|uniref:glycosyltransferase family 4 protein n=1 Tax=Micromonospora sp. KC606 TaxID=2530379 RepID=UPI00104B38CF|nr:glycosyltransferase family 4 protein [Micromonospora sp. KC606]TDC83291.1 glycosyltransferase [Micromonospora sp. KC606]
MNDLLIVGHGGCRTGYGRVLRSLARHLSAHTRLRYLTLGRPEPVPPGVTMVEPVQRGDLYGFASLPQVLRNHPTDTLLACHDPTVLAGYARIARRVAPAVRVVLYLPMEWQRLPEEVLDGLALANHIVCYTQTARSWLTGQWPAGRPTPPVSVIGHGVDRTAFRPLYSGPDPRRARSRRRARQLLGIPDDQFLILNGNRDTPRKRLDLTLCAVAECARALPSTHLVLVHGQHRRDEVARLGLTGRVTVPDHQPDDATLNLYYNAADVGLNTSAAEGWGLVSFEHAAAGAAQIVPDQPAAREIWAGDAVTVPCHTVADPDPVPGYGEVDVAACALALRQLGEDPGLRARWDGAASRVANRRDNDWAFLAHQWLVPLAMPQAATT